VQQQAEVLVMGSAKLRVTQEEVLLLAGRGVMQAFDIVSPHLKEQSSS
jgi:hypothetical protein